MKKINLLFVSLAICGLIGFSVPAHASKTYQSGGLTTTDQHELDNATPGTQKILGGYGLGHALAGYFAGGVYGTKNDAAGNITATSPASTITIGANSTLPSVILWATPNQNYSFTLPNGLPGQSISIVKVNSANTAGSKITPSTKTGFTDITLTNQGDGVELDYVDDTIGWRCAGVFGGSTDGKCNP